MLTVKTNDHHNISNAMASSNQTFSCETCNSTFNSRDELKKHSIKEHEDRATNTAIGTNSELTFKCETCNAVFSLREELRQHSIKEHEGKR
jgi:uncharacterized C2H2 Zn-finger protein